MKSPRTKSLLHVIPLLALLISLLGSAISITPARAIPGTFINVNTTADELNSDGDCSLREAIQSANTGSAVDACASGPSPIINIPAGTYTLTIAGAIEDGNTTGDLDISSSLTISGAGASSTIIQAGTIGYPSPSANGIDAVFHITGNYSVTIQNVTIANGTVGGLFTSFSGGSLTMINSVFSGNQGGNGGGIANYSLSTMTLDGVTFSNNHASSLGGAIYTQSGTNTIRRSTFTGNSADQGGAVMLYANTTIVNSTFANNLANLAGGIYVGNGSTATVANSTIAYNTSTSYIDWAGGLFTNGSTVHLNNTIIAKNTANGYAGDCRRNSGTETVDGTNNLIQSDGYSIYGCGAGTTNLIGGLDPKLASLTGSPAYFELVSNSPAIDAGSDAVCAADPVYNNSQNGATRPVGAHCEMGSYEGSGVAAPAVHLNPLNLSYGLHEVGTTTNYALTVTVTNTGTGSLNIGTLGISGDFNLANNTCDSASLASSGTCTFDVSFSPTAAGTRTGSVSIPSDAASSPDTVNLNGTGYVSQTSTFTSLGNYDGYVVESGENTDVGGTASTIGGVLMVGDDRLDRQMMSFLHFDTSSLPDNAIITGITLRIKQQSIFGTNPFSTHGPLYVDFGTPFFGAEVALKKADFEAYPSLNYQGPFGSTLLLGNWYEAFLSNAYYLNLSGSTQFRLRFDLDDNDDNGFDIIRFFSGNYPNASYRPTLIVEYFVP